MLEGQVESKCILHLIFDSNPMIYILHNKECFQTPLLIKYY